MYQCWITFSIKASLIENSKISQDLLFRLKVFESWVSQPKQPSKKRSFHWKYNMFSVVCVFSIEQSYFISKQKHCHMFLPPGSMPSECIKYQLIFTMFLAFTEKTSQIMHSIMKLSPFMHTLQSIWPLYTSSSGDSGGKKNSFLKVENTQRIYNCVLSIATTIHLSIFCLCCVNVNS